MAEILGVLGLVTKIGKSDPPPPFKAIYVVIILISGWAGGWRIQWNPGQWSHRILPASGGQGRHTGTSWPWTTSLPGIHIIALLFINYTRAFLVMNLLLLKYLLIKPFIEEK